MQSGLQHQWDGTPRELAVLWSLHKGKRTARCAVVVSHPLGWELRLAVASDLLRGEVFRQQNTLLDAADAWKKAMTDKGWA